MNVFSTKYPITYLLLAVCLGAAPTALAQTQFLSSSSVKSSNKPSEHISLSPSRAYSLANVAPMTPDQSAAIKQSLALSSAAAADQHAGRFAQAEAEAREGLSVDPMIGVNAVVLALALESEGKTQEALQVYQSRLITQDQQGLHGDASDLLPYAELLLNSGQWKQALAAYNAALPLVGDSFSNVEARLKAAGPSGQIIQDGEVLAANSHFSPDVPEPGRLALMIHLARGVKFNGEEDWAHEPQNTEAFAEYGKALRFAPNSALANYFYGVGWNKLSPAEQQQFGSIQQARAALTKAVKLAKGPLKVKAQKALMVAMKTK